jgi:putative acetyltransferase
VSFSIRPERAGDARAIRSVTELAFAGHAHSDGSEAEIIGRLRADGDLALSLVVEDEGRIIGHIAFSRVSISDGAREWYGLGPVSVSPEKQGRQVGAQLVQHGLRELASRGARGVVLLGDPAYYCRFGFEHDPGLTYPGPPPEYFQRLVLAGEPPAGVVRYARAFGERSLAIGRPIRTVLPGARSDSHSTLPGSNSSTTVEPR